MPIGIETTGGMTVRDIFGPAPSPLVLASGPNGGEAGGYHFPVVEPMSGVQTVDHHGGGLMRIPHARNLLQPMHSEAFWFLMISLALVGVFGLGAHLRLGPVHFGGQVGKA